MAENKKSFLLYCDLINVTNKLSDEQAGQLFKHLLAYVNDENPEPPNLIVDLAFEPIKQSLKRDLVKYESIRQQRAKAGKRSGEARRTKRTSVNSVEQKATKRTVSVSVSDSDSVNVSDINKQKKEANASKEKSLSLIDLNKINFEDFWEAYQKKVGEKEKVKKKWDKLSYQVQNEILDYIPNYILSQPNKKFRKNPETFLNNKGWLDELVFDKNNPEVKKVERLERIKKNMTGWGI